MSSSRVRHLLRSLSLVLLGLVALAVALPSASATGTSSDAVRIVLDSPPPRLGFNAEADVAGSLSCTSDGDCTLGGSYYIQNYAAHAMLATSSGGVWSNGTTPPGLDYTSDDSLWSVGSAIQAVSCSSAGECAMVGLGALPNYITKPFVANKTGGTWHEPQFVPDGGIFVNDYNIRFTSLSCSAAGECVAVGRSGHDCGDYCWVNEAFLFVQTGGMWQPAIRVPGLAGMNTGSDSQITSVSCSSAGNCMVGGFFSVNPPSAVEVRPFVATSTNGIWSNAVTIPDVTPPNVDSIGTSYPRMNVSVSCPTDGNCVVGGSYTGYSALFTPFPDRWGFVATQSGGTWTTVLTGDLLSPGTTPRTNTSVTSVSCATAYDCTAVGKTTTGDAQQGFVNQGFIATLSGATWIATPIPGLSALDSGSDAAVTALSCAPTGTCALGGSYADGSQRHAFVASKNDGVWSDAVAVPQLNAMNLGGLSEVTAVSCSSTGDCSAIGFYRFDSPQSGKQRVFAMRVSEGRAGGDTETTTTTTSQSTTTTTADGPGSSDGVDGSGQSRTGDDANGGATGPVVPAFTG